MSAYMHEYMTVQLHRRPRTERYFYTIINIQIYTCTYMCVCVCIYIDGTVHTCDDAGPLVRCRTL